MNAAPTVLRAVTEGTGPAPTRRLLHLKGGRPALVVFCGPPCSGKTTLALRLAASMASRYLSMDEFRAQFLPGCHDRGRIDIAYQIMHDNAYRLLKDGLSVVLDSTYSRPEQRRDVESLSVASGARLFAIQCFAPPDVVVHRLRNRQSDHPATDLTEARASTLASQYPFLEGFLRIDTTTSIDACLSLVERLLSSGRRTAPGSWCGVGRSELLERSRPRAADAFTSPGGRRARDRSVAGARRSRPPLEG